MNYFSFVFVSLATILGIYAGVIGFKEYASITKSTEKLSFSRTVKTATLFGLGAALILFSIILFAGVLEENYVWSFSKIESAVFLSVILGSIVTLGTVYQIYTTVIFKDRLISKYKEKDNPENHNS